MQISFRRALAEAIGAFAIALAFILALAPSAPFVGELGVCESGAVRDVLAGNIVLPHFLPGPMVHVPPLYWWTAAIGVHAFGWTELALRLPSILASAMTCAIVYLWAAIAINRRVAFWAAASLLLCHFFLDAARQPRMDSMLALFVTAAAIAFERALCRSADNSTLTIDLRSRRIGLMLAAIMMGLGILTKGILGILLPGLVVGLYFLVRWQWREFFRVDLIATFFAALLIGLSWYFAAYQVGGEKFLQWQLAMNLWSRFIPAEAGGAGYCVHPFWYFTPHTLAGFVPWTVYIPALAIYVWPRRGCKLPEPVVFALCWFTAIFVFFSTSHGKCLVYILPAFPPLAVLIGITIDAAIARNLRDPEVSGAESLNQSPAASAPAGPPSTTQMPAPTASLDRSFLNIYAIGTAVVAIAAIVISIAAILAIVFGVPSGLALRLHPTDRRFLEIFSSLAMRYSPALLGWIAAFIAAGVTGIIGLRRRDPQLQATGVLIVAAAGSLFWFAVMNPRLSEGETLRDFAREVGRVVPAGNEVAHLGLSDCELNFYSVQPLTPIYRLRCDQGPDAPRFIVARRNDFEATRVDNRQCFKPILESAPVDGNGTRILLQRNPPG